MRLAPPAAGLQIALVRLPARLQRALKHFRKITGRSAVTSVATLVPDSDAPLLLSPPLHPRCARRLRSISDAPCARQWQLHTNAVGRSSRTNQHVCPIGLRCSCVPIRLGDHLVGVAKLVVDVATPDADLKNALSILEMVTSETCHRLAVTALTEEVRSLQARLTTLQELNLNQPSQATRSEPPSAPRTMIVNRAITHLQLHYPSQELSLQDVARALGCNPKYLTTRFSEIAGEHMHAYLVRLRVSHACRLLIATGDSVKSISFATGFAGPGRLASAFRKHVGVSPSEYRRIFSRP